MESNGNRDSDSLIIDDNDATRVIEFKYRPARFPVHLDALVVAPTTGQAWHATVLNLSEDGAGVCMELDENANVVLTLPPLGNLTVSPIEARVCRQSRGLCGITFSITTSQQRLELIRYLIRLGHGHGS